MSRRLIATPLAAWEREGVKVALVKAALPADDVDNPRALLWRFETLEGIPVGFGGLEVCGSDALLRSRITLPPLRQVGMGAAMAAMLEIRGAGSQMSRDIGSEFLRPARLCCLRARRRAGKSARQPTIHRAPSVDRKRNGQAHRLERSRRRSW